MEETDLRRLKLDSASSSSERSRSRFLARSASFLASSSSATPDLTRHISHSERGKPNTEIKAGQGKRGREPHLFSSTSGFSLVSLGWSFGFRSCWDRDGREAYGRSWAEALHSYE